MEVGGNGWEKWVSRHLSIQHLMRAKNYFIVNLLCIYPSRFLAIPPALVSIMIVDSIEDILSTKRERYDIT